MASSQAAYSAIVDDTDDLPQSAPTNEPPAATPDTTESPSRRGQVMTGPLPDGFLQMGPNLQNHQPVPVGYQQAMFGGFHQSTVGLLNITIVQARLAKNYGLARMDPFCRLRIGAMVFETPTAYNGSKTPRWNKMVQSQLPPGVNEFYIELYDECTFSIDEKIAWGLIKIKDECFEGQTVDDWYTLTGKQGDDKEGMIQIVMDYKKGVAPMMMNPMMGAHPMMVQQPVPYGPGVMYGYPQMMYAPPQQIPAMPPTQIMSSQHPQQPGQPTGDEIPASSVGQINEKDLQALKEMCPSLDDDILRSVYQQAGGNLDRAAAQLIEMSAS